MSVSILRYCQLYRVYSTEAFYELFDCYIADIAAAIAIRKGFDEGVKCRLIESNLNESWLFDSMYRVGEKIFYLDWTTFFPHLTVSY